VSETLRFGPYSVEATHLDKVLFPGEGITKGDLIDYYRDIAGSILPYLEERPVVMQRFPEGIGADGFYMKNVPDYFPDWIETVTVAKKEGSVTHAVVGNEATLVYLANQGTITPHVWLSRIDALRAPDRIVFDLDPPENDFDSVRDGARAIRELIEEVGLVPFAMTTGGRGVHVVVPIDRGPEFDDVRAFARGVADLLAERHPDRFTTETRKAKREGRLFLDYLRNSYAQTAVPPYAVRPRPGAPVAMPIAWDELDESDLRGDRWTIESARRRLARADDPWKGHRRRARELERAAERLSGLAAKTGS